MHKKNRFTKILAAAGTVIAWFPIAAPILLGITFRFRTGFFRIDYLMPAELFPAVLLGGGLLLWASLRAQRRRRWIVGGLAAAAGLLVGSQALAVATGLASGETEAVGLHWVLVLILLGAYVLAVIAVGVGGILLLKDLSRKGEEE